MPPRPPADPPTPVPPGDDPWYAALADLLDRSHQVTPDGIPAAVDAALEPMAVTATIHLVDTEQRQLRPLPGPGRRAPRLAVDTTLAGRAFTQVRTERAGTRLWIPLVDGTDRLGVLEVALPAGSDGATGAVQAGCQRLASLVGHLVATKSAYGDALLRHRRNRPMSVSAELLWHLLPPLTMTTGNATVSAVLEPCYDIGGDAFDYAVEDSTVDLAILDAVGHGLPAAVTTAVALSALRAARRAGEDLVAAVRAVDAAVTDQWDDSRFVTAVVARLNMSSGELWYVNAGHPPPLVLRRGRAVRALHGGRRLPLGLPTGRFELGRERLEPGDTLLLHTDGVTEARDAGGELFGVGRLADLAERHTGAGLPAAETLRRINQAVGAHQDGQLRDDATVMLLQWSAEAVRRSAPGWARGGPGTT